MTHFVEVETRRNGKVTAYNMDGYTTRKTVMGALHEISKEVAKIDVGEAEILANVKTESEAKNALVRNESADTYCLELEEVTCASSYNEETDEVEYEEGHFYFHIRFFVWSDDEEEEIAEQEREIQEVRDTYEDNLKYGTEYAEVEAYGNALALVMNQFKVWQYHKVTDLMRHKARTLANTAIERIVF